MTLEEMTNKVWCADCLEFMKQMPDKSIDLVVTDPPYNYQINGGGSLGKKYDGYKERVNNLGDFNARQFLNLIKTKLKIFNAYVWCGKEELLNIALWAREQKLNWNIIVWGKPNPMPAYNNTYLPDLEFCVFIRQTKATFNNGLDYKMYRRMLIHPIGATNFEHPTVKPLWIIERAIKISSKLNDIILDPFLGSGTTAVAAQVLGRRFIGIELSEKYCQIARERLSQKPLGI